MTDSSLKMDKAFTDDGSSTSHFSRSCPVCLCESPFRRGVFTSCGHIICFPCGLHIAQDAFDSGTPFTCPLCRQAGKCFALQEKRMGDACTEEQNLLFEEAISETNSADGKFRSDRDAEIEARHKLEAAVKTLEDAETSLAHTLENQIAARLAVAFAKVALRNALAEKERAFEAASRAKAEMITSMRKENEMSAEFKLRYSRTCPGCYTESRHRVVLAKCGQAICRECADRKATHASDADGPTLACPECSTDSGFVNLYEPIDGTDS